MLFLLGRQTSLSSGDQALKNFECKDGVTIKIKNWIPASGGA